MTTTSNVFEKISELYAEARPQYPAELFSYIASLSEQHECVWDCATGNGQAAKALAAHYAHIEATDLSTSQISQGYQDSKIHYSAQPAEKTNFADNQFDLVTVAQALHWFDLDQFWPEVQRVLKPGGAFVTVAYSWSGVTPEIDAALEEHLLSVIRPYWAQNNQLVWEGYAAIQWPFEPLDTPKFDMLMHWSLEELFLYLRSWSAVKHCMDAQGDMFFESAKAQVAKIWGEPAQKKLITTPITLVAGKAW